MCKLFALPFTQCILDNANDLQDRTMKSSKYKQQILHYFEEDRDQRFSASRIYQQMQNDQININLVTVYRNLEKLCEENALIKTMDITGEEALYQYARKDHACMNHIHLYCRRCGRIIHLSDSEMQDLSSFLIKTHGFRLECAHSMLVGLCETCAKEEGEIK